MPTSATLTILKQADAYSFQWHNAPAGMPPVALLCQQQANPSLQSQIERAIGSLNQLLIQRQREQATSSSQLSEDDPLRGLGRLIFHQLFPEPIQQALDRLPPNSLITLLTNDNTLPWELAHTQTGYLALIHTISRHLLTANLLTPRTELPEIKWSALLIGNPTADLPHTAAEIEQVATLLEAMPGAMPPRILMQRRATKATVLQELASGSYTLIHYAGHARFVANDPTASGLLLAKGEVLSIQELQQTLAGRPFVFLNGCESARTADGTTASADHVPNAGNARNAPAELIHGLAQAFLLGGARGVLGTQWSIHDATSQHFAAAFYRALLRGTTIDGAVQAARSHLHHTNPADPLWASFLLYASPNEPLIVTSQRTARLGTTMALDVAQLTAGFFNENGERVSRRIDSVHHCFATQVARFGGQLIPTTAETLLAIFSPTPAIQNDAERAIRAAQAILQSVDADVSLSDAESQARAMIGGIGITGGELYWSPNATTDGVTANISPVLGQPVRNAIHLAQLATNGEILLDNTVRKLIQRIFPIESVVVEPVNGSMDTVAMAFRLLPTVAASAQPFPSYGPETRFTFVGRQRELAMLAEIWQRCWPQQKSGSRRGKIQGQLVGIAGEAGVGKSRLIQAWADGISADEAYWLHARAPTVYHASPYELITQLLQTLLNVNPPTEEQAKHEQATAGFHNGLIERLRQLPGRHSEPQVQESVALLCELLDWPLPAIATAHLDLQARQRRLVNLLGMLLAERATTIPIIIVLDDLNGADESSLEILEQLTAGLDRLPILLVTLFRSEQAWQPPWWHRRNYQQINLDALDEDAGGELLRTMLDGDETGEELIDLLLERSGGNPLFVQELVAVLIEEGLLTQKNGRWQISRRNGQPQLPGTIHRVLLSRLDALPATARHALAVAALIGEPVAFPLLQAATQPNLEADLLDVALTELETRNLLYQQWGDTAFYFHHALIREVAYTSTALDERRRLHRRIGELLEEEEDTVALLEQIAHHFYQSVVVPTAAGALEVVPTVDATKVNRAIDYLQQAGERAYQKYAARGAIYHYQRALDLAEFLSAAIANTGNTTTDAHTILLLEQLGAAYQTISELDDAIGVLMTAYERRQATERSLTRNQQAELARRIGHLYEWKSEYLTALQWMESGLTLVDGEDGEAERTTAAALHVRVGCVRYSQGDHSEAAAQSERGLALTADFDDHPVQAEAHNLLGSIHDLQGATATALEHYQQSLAIYGALENAYEVARVENNLGLIYLRNGEWPEAKAHLQRGITFWEEIEDQYNLAFNRLNLGVIELYQGNWNEAEACFRHALSIWGEADNQRWSALCHTNLGLLFVEQERWDEAHAHLEESRALIMQQGIRHFLPEVTYALAAVALGRANPTEAVTLAGEAITLAAELEMKLETAIAQRILGEAQMALGDLDVAENSLAASLSLLQALDNRYEVARTLAQLGALATQQGELDIAKARRAEALQHFTDLGAVADQRRVRQSN